MKETQILENSRLERKPIMIKTKDSQSSWSNISSAVLAIANAGALIWGIVLIAMLLISTPVFAQGGTKAKITVDLSQTEQDLNGVAKEVQSALDEIGAETGININIDQAESGNRPKLGVYLSNMDFEDAYKMRYPYAFGVLVNGTVSGGNADKAGIIEDDIIMYFGGTKVLYEDHLVRLIKGQHYGDQVPVVFWRDEAMDTTLVTFTHPKEMDEDQQLALVDEEKESKARNSHGYGGGGFTPMLVQDQFTDVVTLMNNLGLSSTPFRSEGIVLWGGAGQGYVGNGWFMGGFGNGGNLSNTVNIIDGTNEVTRTIDFSMGFGGLTVEKRLAPFSWVVLGGGVGLGGGSINLAVSQDDGAYHWNTLGTDLLTNKSSSLQFSKSYAIVHPRASLMVKLTSWMRLKAEYGYLYGYAFSDGWKTTLGSGTVDVNQDSYELVGSPNTELQASTISLGLWFGF